jgi:enamine deaminase RidA (YjgF/YER057c/UK114 family)
MTSSVQHVPFESVWKMRIDHPYSLFVRDGSHFWSCGQCPLNEAGDVLHPNDLFAQARALTGIIDQLLGKIDADRSAVTQLVVYYIKTTDGDGQRLTHLLSGFFDTNVLIVPVSVPHFYYDGMMIEIDVQGAVGEKAVRLFTDQSMGSSLQVIDAGDLSYAVLLVPSKVDLVGVCEAAAG